MNGYQQTAGRYQDAAAACIDDALRHSDDGTERMALLRTAGLWLALAALARKLVILG